MAGPVAGTSLNAGTSDPHYSLLLQTSNGNGIGGTLTYVFEDGTSNQLSTISGTASGGSRRHAQHGVGVHAAVTFTLQ